VLLKLGRRLLLLAESRERLDVETRERIDDLVRVRIHQLALAQAWFGSEEEEGRFGMLLHFHCDQSVCRSRVNDSGPG
jgi:hypothetical protein